jgi:hypothetical protein
MSEVDMGVVEQVIDEVVDEAGKSYIPRVMMGSLGGMVIGGVVGYFFAQRRLETKYAKIADAEIEEMREHYLNKAKAADGEAQKGALQSIVESKGYSSSSTPPPMAVQPPESVVDGDDERAPDDSEMSADEHTPDVEKFSPQTRNVFREVQVEHEWDWRAERRRRSPDAPYVIHHEECHENEEYSQVTLTYYAGDDVLCNERDDIVDPADRDRLIGEKNLDRFGHGSDDPVIVYIRNDSLEIVYEVIKSPNHYAEEVQGFSHNSSHYKNLERMRTRERDEQED